MCVAIADYLLWCFGLLIRLPEWAQKAINGPMEYIAQFDYKTYADTPELARLKSGFLLKEMFEHISQKVSGTLKPNRSLWLYSGHDLTILNMLNSLGLFEVCLNIFNWLWIFIQNFTKFSAPHISLCCYFALGTLQKCPRWILCATFLQKIERGTSDTNENTTMWREMSIKSIPCNL